MAKYKLHKLTKKEKKEIAETVGMLNILSFTPNSYCVVDKKGKPLLRDGEILVYITNTHYCDNLKINDFLQNIEAYECFHHLDTNAKIIIENTFDLMVKDFTIMTKFLLDEDEIEGCQILGCNSNILEQQTVSDELLEKINIALNAINDVDLYTGVIGDIIKDNTREIDWDEDPDYSYE